jgi:hypothetical protein
MKRLQLAGFAVITVLACAPLASSQVSDKQPGVTIAVDEATFSEKQKAKVRLRVENKTGQAINDERTSVNFYLSAFGTDLSRCTITDCFNTYVFLSKKLRGGQVAESEIDLAGLRWRPLISAYGQGWLRNMFKVVPPGEYYLFVRISSRPDKGDTRTIETSSNAILIKVNGQR